MRKPRPSDIFAQSMFGRNPQECYAKGICLVCGSNATEFTDERSKREYEISVMCQTCQNATFSVDNE